MPSGLEELELFPGDHNLRDDPPAEAAPGAGTPDLEVLGSDRPGRPVGVTERHAAVGFDGFDPPHEPARVAVPTEPDRLAVPQAEAVEGDRGTGTHEPHRRRRDDVCRRSGRVRIGPRNRSVKPV